MPRRNGEITTQFRDFHDVNQQDLQWDLLLSGTTITRLPRPSTEGGGFHSCKGFLSASRNATDNTFKLFFDKSKVQFKSQFPSSVDAKLFNTASFGTNPAASFTFEVFNYQLTGNEPFVRVGLVSASYSQASGSIIPPLFHQMTASVHITGPRSTFR